MDKKTHTKEDQPQHRTSNSAPHLALGRFRLCPWKSKPSHQRPHGPQHPRLEAWSLVVCMRDRGAQKPDRRGEGRQRSRGGLMDDGGRMVAPRRHVHMFVRPPRVTFRYQPLRQSPEPEHFRRRITQAELQPGGEGRGLGRVKGPPSRDHHHFGGNEIRTRQMPFNLRRWDLVLGHFQPRNCVRELRRTRGMKTDPHPHQMQHAP